MNVITKNQIRAARALLGWNQEKLSSLAGVAKPTVANIELGKQNPSAETLLRIQTAIEIAGVEFIAGEGVRKTESQLRSFTGSFDEFLSFVDQVALQTPGQTFYVSNVDESFFLENQTPEATEKHEQAILESKIRYKIMVSESNSEFPAKTYADYRVLSKEHFLPVPTYIFGEYVALITQNKEINIVVMNNPTLCETFRLQFEHYWGQAQKPYS